MLLLPSSSMRADTPAETVGALVVLFPTVGGFPLAPGGSASALRVSRPGSLAFRPACLLSGLRHPFVQSASAYTSVDAGHEGPAMRPRAGTGARKRRSGAGRSKPLCADWREALCAPTRRELGTAPPLSEIADWAAMEYGRSPDGRLRARLVDMGRRWEESPGAPVCAIFPQRAEQKAAYRFLSNGQVTMDDILEPHRKALTERCRLERTVLVAQDTTTLNYTSRRNRTGDLVKIGGGGRGVHASLAFTEGGRPLGVLALDADARKSADELSEVSEEKESIRWFDGLAAAQELGRACGPARGRVVNVCEADIYDLFKAQAAAPDEAGLLVRANRGRQHKVAHGEATPGLWEHMEKLSPCAARTVRARGGQHARKKRAARIAHRKGRFMRARRKRRNAGSNGGFRNRTVAAEERSGAVLDAAVQRGRSDSGERAAHPRLVRTEVGH